MILTLPLIAEYFHQIARGEKVEEYRLDTPYWRSRLMGKAYTGIVLTLGYPKREDQSRRLFRPWRGYRITEIVHPHFGNQPVRVFAIDVRPDPLVPRRPEP